MHKHCRLRDIKSARDGDRLSSDSPDVHSARQPDIAVEASASTAAAHDAKYLLSWSSREVIPAGQPRRAILHDFAHTSYRTPNVRIDSIRARRRQSLLAFSGAVFARGSARPTSCDDTPWRLSNAGLDHNRSERQPATGSLLYARPEFNVRCWGRTRPRGMGVSRPRAAVLTRELRTTHAQCPLLATPAIPRRLSTCSQKRYRVCIRRACLASGC